MVNRIDTTPARISSNVSQRRTTPNLSFGDRVRAGLARGSAADLSAGVEEIVAAVVDAEAYAKLHSPSLRNALASVRIQLQSIATRSKQSSSSQTVVTPVGGGTNPKP